MMQQARKNATKKSEERHFVVFTTALKHPLDGGPT
jgi:hypothetical protein